MRGEQLLLHAADRQHLALQRHLAGHANLAADRPTRQQARERRHHGDARGGPVLRNRARGDMDVEATLVEPVDRQAQLAGVRAHIGEGDLRRLLHDVTELAGDRQARVARHCRCLDEEDVAADTGNGQPCGDTGHGGAVGDLEEELRSSEVLTHVISADGDRRGRVA